jgi:hypothetical protein
MSKRLLSWALAGVFGAGSWAVAPMAAQAGSKGRKTTAQVLTGVAAYQLLRGKTKTGLIVGAGAAYAWKRHRDARKAEKRRARSLSYRSSYRTRYGRTRTASYSSSRRHRRSHR